jgi:hypothetical protein
MHIEASLSNSTAAREHHFVPQFYLRNFSLDGKRVNLFNFERDRVILHASIKHQCSRHNFYNFAPQLERAFSGLEGEAARIIRDIRTKADIPERGSPAWISLLTFIIFQKLRTVRSGRMNDAMTDYMAKIWIENDPEFKHIDPDGIEIRNSYPVAMPLKAAKHVLPAAADLQMHLLVNESSQEFLTSDDPVVAHNQFCEGISYQGVTGWNCRGLQMVWPISPAELILLFDPIVYKVGMSHKGCRWTKIVGRKDVDQLNSLQILNAEQNVYFAGCRDPAGVERQCHDLSPQRSKTRAVFVETEPVAHEDEQASSSILHMYEPLLPIKLCVSAITLRKKAKRVPLDARASMYRKIIEPSEEERAKYGKAPPGRYAVKRVIRK